MRKELYDKIKQRLTLLCVNAVGEYHIAPPDADDDLSNRAIKHIDLWNQNVEFIEQESAWERPAVFVEIEPVQWKSYSAGDRVPSRGTGASAYRDRLGICRVRRFRWFRAIL